MRQTRPMSRSLSRAGRSRLLSWVVPVVLVLAAFVSVVVHVPQNTELSPLDEYVYVDYIAKVPSEGVVAEGEPTGAFAREALVCLGNRGVATVVPTSCADAGTAPASDFPMAGKTSADIYTPLYFWVTRALAQPLVWAGVGLIDAASLVGALWLAGALVLLVFAMRRWRVREPVILGLGLFLIASPAAYWSSTYISTDAPSLAVGAALALVVARFATGGRGLWLLPVVSAVGVAFKVQNIAAVGIAVLAVVVTTVVRTAQQDDSGGAWGVARRAVLSRPVVTAVGSAVLALVVQGVWLVVRSDLRVALPPDQGTARPLHIGDMVGESLKFLAGTPTDPTGVENGWQIATAGLVLGWLSVAGVLGAIGAVADGRGVRPLAWSALVVALLLGPMLVLGTVLVSGYYFALPTRYGLSMLPVFLVLAGVVLSRYRAPGVLLAIAGAASFAASLTGS